MNRSRVIMIAIVTLSLSGCSSCSSNKSDTSYLETSSYSEPTDERLEEKAEYARSKNSINIPYTEQYGNTITIPVKINGMGLDMIYDTGTSTTTITLSEAKYLYEKGLLKEEDFIGIEHFQSADGSIHEGLRIKIRKLEIGNKICLYDIEASVVENQQVPLLLGQSVMKHFREIF